MSNPALICTTNHSLDPSVSIISTDYEVSTTPDMKNIVCYSYNDTVNKETIVFDYEPKKGVTYYGRTRSILTTGPLEYGPVSSWTCDGDEEFLLTTPSPINTPVITTIHLRNEHPHTCFTVEATPFQVIGNSKHVKTIWSIHDAVTGELMTTKTSTLHLLKWSVTSMLDFEKHYVISAIFVADNDCYSEVGSINISTGACFLNRSLDLVTTEDDVVIFKDTPFPLTAQHEWYLLNEENYQVNPASTELSNTSSFFINKDWLEDDKLYLIQTRVVSEDLPDAEYEYHSFKTVNQKLYGLPGRFPYELGTGSQPL